MCGVVAWRNGSSREAGIGTPVGRFFILANNTLFVNAVRPVLAPIGVAEADAPTPGRGVENAAAEHLQHGSWRRRMCE